MKWACTNLMEAGYNLELFRKHARKKKEDFFPHSNLTNNRTFKCKNNKRTFFPFPASFPLSAGEFLISTFFGQKIDVVCHLQWWLCKKCQKRCEPYILCGFREKCWLFTLHRQIRIFRSIQLLICAFYRHLVASFASVFGVIAARGRGTQKQRLLAQCLLPE